MCQSSQHHNSMCECVPLKKFNTRSLFRILSRITSKRCFCPINNYKKKSACDTELVNLNCVGTSSRNGHSLESICAAIPRDAIQSYCLILTNGFD